LYSQGSGTVRLVIAKTPPEPCEYNPLHYAVHGIKPNRCHTRIPLALSLTFSAIFLMRQNVSADSGGEPSASEGSEHGLDPFVLIGVAIILLVSWNPDDGRIEL
jgi:hypothetical protein